MFLIVAIMSLSFAGILVMLLALSGDKISKEMFAFGMVLILGAAVAAINVKPGEDCLVGSKCWNTKAYRE